MYRATTALRPHPRYQELRGPMAATRLQRAARQAGAIQEPLLTTVDGTILGRTRAVAGGDRLRAVDAALLRVRRDR